MLMITNQVQFQIFLESRNGFDLPNSCSKTLPNTWTSDLKGPISHFSLGSRHKFSVRRTAILYWKEGSDYCIMERTEEKEIIVLSQKRRCVDQKLSDKAEEEGI